MFIKSFHGSFLLPLNNELIDSPESSNDSDKALFYVIMNSYLIYRVFQFISGIIDMNVPISFWSVKSFSSWPLIRIVVISAIFKKFKVVLFLFVLLGSFFATRYSG